MLTFCEKKRDKGFCCSPTVFLLSVSAAMGVGALAVLAMLKKNDAKRLIAGAEKKCVKAMDAAVDKMNMDKKDSPCCSCD